jgi:hypothetical protein
MSNNSPLEVRRYRPYPSIHTMVSGTTPFGPVPVSPWTVQVF